MAVPLGIALLSFAARFAWSRTDAAARALFLASIVYLPLIWVAMIWDKQ
jgi:heme O synthase-like polyprenyltransferase